METTVDVAQSQIEQIVVELLAYRDKVLKQVITGVGIYAEQPIPALQEELRRKGISIEYCKHKGIETLRAISAEGEILAEKRFTMKGVL